MDIHSVAVRPEDVLVTFRLGIPPKAGPREGTSRENVAPKSHTEPSGRANEPEPRVNTLRNTEISFSINEDLGKTIVKVIDRDTNEVIRQIPPEEMMRFMARMTKIIGLLLDKKV